MRAPILLLLIGALSLVAPSARAQDPLRPRPPDSLRVDSLRADSLRRKGDTLSSTDKLLQLQQEGRAVVQPLPRCGVSSLLPAAARRVFDRDSIDWAPAQSIGDLLASVPGFYIEHTDWLGMPDLPNFASRGAGSVEYLIDCVPYRPAGPDSLAVDPALSLSMLERVEVELSPGVARVFLFTRRHNRLAPRTAIGASQGDRGATRYFGSFEKRYSHGFGLSLAVDYVGLNPAPDNSGGGNTPSGWLQLSYAPSERFGIQAQVVTQFFDRNVLLEDVTHDTLLAMLKGTRTDEHVRASWRQRRDGLGSSLDLFASHTSWSSDSAPSAVGFGQFGLVAARRAPAWSAQLSAWHYTRTTSLDTRLDLGWSPVQRFTGALQLVGQRHDGSRGSQWATARIGIQLPAGFAVGGVVSDGQRVQTPTLTADLPQRFTDAQLNVGFNSRVLSLDAAYVSNEGWRPQPFQQIVAIPGLAPMGRVNWLNVHGRVTPLNWLTFETLYQNPLGGALPDGTPPAHFVSTATIQSKFMRNFPSGIFGLKIQGVLENWGAGIGGRDTLGNAIPLPAATFFRSIIQFQIGPFIAYYDRINLQATRTGYIPRYPIQVGGQTFGIRWWFNN